MAHNWYALSVHSGKEDFVVEKIQQMIVTLGLKDVISDMLVPKQTKIVVKEGKKLLQKKRSLPGYILVKMEYNNQTVPLLTNIEEVRGFIKTGDQVYPMNDEEIERLRDEKPQGQSNQKMYITTVRVNDAVKIKEGPFIDMLGKVSHVDDVKGKVKVLVNLMGRDIPYELPIENIEKL